MSGTPGRPDWIVGTAHKACMPSCVPPRGDVLQTGYSTAEAQHLGLMIPCWGIVHTEQHCRPLPSRRQWYASHGSNNKNCPQTLPHFLRHAKLTVVHYHWAAEQGSHQVCPRPAAPASPQTMAEIQNLGPILYLLNLNLDFDWILTGPRCTLKSDKR